MTASAGPLWSEPHHDGSPLHAPGHATAGLGDIVEVLLRLPHGGSGCSSVTAVHLRQMCDGEPSYVLATVGHVDAHDVWYRAPLRVRNRLTRYRWLLVDEDGYRWATAAGVIGHDVTDATDHVVSTHPPAPDWAVDGVIYQVFPDRFARSGTDHGPVPDWAVPAGWDEPVVHTGPDTPRQLYGGDLAGIREHLQHLVDLGVDVLYLTPVFPAASNHRYDASSFDEVDPLLGGNEAMTQLVRAAHAAGLKVMGDLTTNHTGATHEWFRAARADPGSEEVGYYYFHEHPDGYESWLGVPSLPKLDHGSAELARRLVDGPGSVVARWLAGPDGLDGWRVDVANMTGRRGGDDHTHDVARRMRATMDATRPGTFLLAEHFHDTVADVTVGAGGWDAVMNYAGFTRPVWEWLAAPDCPYDFLGMPVRVPRKPTADVVATLRLFAASVPWRQTVQNVTMLGSHDTPRIRSVVGSDEALLTALGILVGYPGVPMVFAGDELGLTGDDGEHSRTPMPWGDEDRFGSPVHEAYHRLLHLRREHEALRRGGLRWLEAGADHMAWLRETPGERVAVLVTRAPGQVVQLPVSLLGRSPTLLEGSAAVTVSGDLLTVAPAGVGAVFLGCTP